MRVYVAGPMTGYALYNFPAFAQAAERWRAKGHDVITPPEITEAVWNERFCRSYDPAFDRAEWGDPITCELFQRDLAAVCTVDALALLPGWERSKGAKMEIAVARTLGKVCYCADTFTPLDVEAQITLVGLGVPRAA